MSWPLGQLKCERLSESSFLFTTLLYNTFVIYTVTTVVCHYFSHIYNTFVICTVTTGVCYFFSHLIETHESVIVVPIREGHTSELLDGLLDVGNCDCGLLVLEEYAAILRHSENVASEQR